MKRSVLALVIGGSILVAGGAASAFPPYHRAFEEKYVSDATPGLQLAVQASRCNMCHNGPLKGAGVNAYGGAINKFMNKRDFVAVKNDAEKLKKFLDEGYDKAANEISPKGKTFGELIKADIAPW